MSREPFEPGDLVAISGRDKWLHSRFGREAFVFIAVRQWGTLNLAFLLRGERFIEIEDIHLRRVS